MEYVKLEANDDDSIEYLRNFLKKKMAYPSKSEILLEFSICPSSLYFQKVMQAFFDYKSCYLKMIKYEKSPRLKKLYQDIHEGEKVTYILPTILLGSVKSGGVLEISSLVFVIGKVEGTVRLLSKDASIFATHFHHARIYSWDDQKKILDGDNLLVCSNDWEDSYGKSNGCYKW